ncbi:hypothetical protein C7N43_34080 [Sphingobacteriales bacterium UPWRP_1]|nr:hypothetical protein BVG80_00970 [Sphingobacteriales bacterium TSM_CSM]PSJ72476.1 hypothetical protein C7N43_34080 [Sphingobacteriales bacterium UPWRP_1]
MPALVLSVLCSTLLFVLFKIYGNHRINILQAIVVNYFTCVAMGIITAGTDLLPAGATCNSWLLIALLLGGIFMIGFQLIAHTIRQNGITVATVAAKTTLVLPVTAAFFLYADTFTVTKLLGILLAVAAVVLTSVKQDEQAILLQHRELILPLSVFLLGGIGEILLNFAQKRYLTNDLHHLFTTLTFGAAAITGLFFIVFRRSNLQFKNVAAGILLGIPNYFSIYFLLRALSTTGWQSSVVFPVNNMAIVALSGLLALAVFKEQLSHLNLLGIALAFCAILLMIFS